MFSSFSIQLLQQYWWVIISVLGAAFVFLTFVQGGQTLLMQVAKTKEHKDLIVNSLGRRWDLTFTALVVFGGAFFASFPLFYSTSFGGAYWVWMLILFTFILQAVSYEYRTKAGNFLGQRTYEWFLFFNGFLGTILIGAAVGTFFTGSHFLVERMDITSGEAVSRWTTPTHGLEAIWSVFNGYPAFIVNLTLALSVFALSRVLGGQYLLFTIDNEELTAKIRKQLRICSSLFLVFFLLFLGLLLTKEGFAVDSQTKVVYMEKYKYLHNLIQMPFVLVIMLIGVVMVLWGLFKTLFKKSTNGFWFTAPGAALAVLALFLIAGLNNTSFYPSIENLQYSLTIENASSSRFTLVVMSWVSLFVPVVMAYVWYSWRSLTRKKITNEELNNDNMSY